MVVRTEERRGRRLVVCGICVDSKKEKGKKERRKERKKERKKEKCA